MNETDIDYIITRVSDIPGTYHKLFAEVPKADQDMIHSFTIRRSVEVIRTFAVRPPALSSLPVDTHASFRHTHTPTPSHTRRNSSSSVQCASKSSTSVISHIILVFYIGCCSTTTIQYVRNEWRVNYLRTTCTHRTAVIQQWYQVLHSST